VWPPLYRAVTLPVSEQGGMERYPRAQLRPEPIPVLTGMTSVNPTFILPQALAVRGAQIGDGFVERMLVNVGQACLKPAILLAVEGAGFAALRHAMSTRVSAAPARTILTPGLQGAYLNRLRTPENAGSRHPDTDRRDHRVSAAQLGGKQLLHVRSVPATLPAAHVTAKVDA